MAYNLSALDTGNTLFDYTTVLNSALGGYFASIFLLGFFIILMIGFKNYDTKTGLMAASLITSLVATMFWGLGMLAMPIIFFPAGIFLVALIWRGLE